MKQKPIFHVLSKMLSSWEKNSILRPELKDKTVIGVRYGPLGYLLKRNIYREWLSSCLNNSDVHMFPVQIQNTVSVQQNLSNQAGKKMLLQEVSEQCQNVTSLNDHLPYGLAICSECSISSESTADSSVHSDELQPEINWRPKKWTNMCITFFCASKKSTHWFYYWQRQRYVWWRKFASIPSQFSMSDMAQNCGNHQVSLQFQFPWGTNKIEDVMQVGPDMLDLGCMPAGNESSLPSAVFASTDLDYAVFAYLCNAFREKQRHGKIRTVLQLHHKLAPYKVAVVVDCGCATDSKKLNEVSYLLTKELKRSGITVFPNMQTTQGSVDTDFIRYDEMGLPYCIILSQASLVTGIGLLRNRDTTLEEQVHLTELTSKLLTYLQMTIPS